VGVRQWLNQNSKFAIGAVVGAVIVTVASAAAVIWWSGNRPDGAAHANLAFFSVDDGKTWFPEDLKQLPPFDKDGKQALRAYVFRCGDGGKPFVACLARYAPQTRKQLAALHARDGRPVDPLILRQLELDGLEVKAPGQSAWLRRSNPRAEELIMPTCPDGSAAQPVMPDAAAPP
jgi:hypothetical protein